MTYHIAADTNTALDITGRTFVRKKELADGANCRWCKLEDGSIGVLGGTREDTVLVYLPTKVLKDKFYCQATTITHDQWRIGVIISG